MCAKTLPGMMYCMFIVSSFSSSLLMHMDERMNMMEESNPRPIEIQAKR